MVRRLAPVRMPDGSDEALKECPFVVGHQIACQGHLPRRDDLESQPDAQGNPFCQATLGAEASLWSPGTAANKLSQSTTFFSQQSRGCEPRTKATSSLPLATAAVFLSEVDSSTRTPTPGNFLRYAASRSPTGPCAKELVTPIRSKPLSPTFIARNPRTTCCRCSAPIAASRMKCSPAGVSLLP